MTPASGWIASALLTVIGLDLIRNAMKQDNDRDMLANQTLLALAVATSIDALVLGVTPNLADIPLSASIVVIGVVTFVVSVAGFLFGRRLVSFFGRKLEILGVAPISIGFKLLLS